MTSALKSAVIGLGQIGQGYDYNWPDDSRVLTHASGFHYHVSYELVGGVDLDPAKRIRFEKKFKRPAYESIEALYLNQSPQVLSIAVPTQFHYRVIKEVIQYRPLAVICEKPIAETVEHAEQMISMAEESKCALLVNYMRRFDPGVIALQSKIKRGDFGDIIKGTVWYSKGLLNNGSHFINLLQYLLGDVDQTTIFEKSNIRKIGEYAPDLGIRIGNALVYFLSATKAGYSFNNMCLIGTRGGIRYENGGVDIRTSFVEAHPEYTGYRILNPEWRPIENDLRRHQWHALEKLKYHLHDGEINPSDGTSAMGTLKIIQDLHENALSGDVNE